MTTSIPELSVMIVAYRNAELTRDCLRSVFEETRAAIEVIVVDNASGDGTAEMIAAEFPRVRLLALDENIGFARANNLAVEHARAEWLLLLNPDTIVFDGALDSLLRFGREHPGGGLYGGRTLYPDGRLNPSSCWGLPTLWSMLCFATGLSTLRRGSPVFDPESLGGWERDSIREVGVVTGCLLLVHREVWERLGGFDPRFWMYGEDLDLAVRARAAGLRPMITPAATIVHVVGASSPDDGRKMTMVMRARATVMQLHWRPAAAALGTWLLTVGAGLRALATAAAGVAGRRRRQTVWPAVWARRREWRTGYAAGSQRLERTSRVP
jgi:N-acetylglucosaminyl-diphospho-decaprenol L-rhamnosyltransferase